MHYNIEIVIFVYVLLCLMERQWSIAHTAH